MNARGHWAPVLSREYGIQPWDMRRLRRGELRDLQRDHEELQRGE